MSKPREVVVIDDSSEIGELVCAAAARVNIDCTATDRVDDFLAALTAETDLILMDIKMPEMNGRELLELLATHYCGARIVLMSGVGRGVLAEAESYGRSLGLNMAGILPKPFRVAELVAMLQQ